MKLAANKISHAFGKNPVLDDVSLECELGAITSIFGRNGTGKSTLLKILFGVLKSPGFKLNINGRTYSPKEIIPKKLIAYLPQHNFLPRNSKVRDVIPLYFEDNEDQNRVFYAPNMASFHNKLIKTLSMGERRYLELLMIINLPHPFVLLDEPFSMVEPRYIEIIKEVILQAKETKGIIISDHYYKDVFSISDNHLLLKEGKLITVQNIDDLKYEGYLPDGISHLYSSSR